jgi:hypothetical protein
MKGDSDTTSSILRPRRAILKRFGALSVVGLAGCGGDGDSATTSPTDTTTSESEEGTTLPPETTASSSTPIDTATPTDTATPPTVPPEERPPSVTPAGTIGSPPKDATILFGEGVDGLKKWTGNWNVADDGSYFEINPGSGDIKTTEPLGDCHLHIEFSPPDEPLSDFDPGNSGVYMMDRYELQLLNNPESGVTFNDGIGGALYAQSAPLVDPARPGTEWQSFDIIWQAPNFEDGSVADPGQLTMFFNGVLIQAHVNVQGPTDGGGSPYSPHPAELPVRLQDKGYPIRFRNVWYRSLPPGEDVETGTSDKYLPSYNDEYQDVYRGEPVYTLEPRDGGSGDSDTVEDVVPGATWGDPPSHATVLLGDDGSLEGWESADGGSPGWREADGYVAVEPGAGDIRTTRAFSDCRLHAEFRIPEDVSGVGSRRGNSGLLVANRYEIQILDNHENVSEPTEWVGAYTGQAPPMASPTRPPGEWQSFDVLWQGPRFDGGGTIRRRPARLTALLNGVVVQRRLYVNGSNTGSSIDYKSHSPAQPLGLQENGDPVHFRNIWYTPVE